MELSASIFSPLNTVKYSLWDVQISFSESIPKSAFFALIQRCLLSEAYSNGILAKFPVLRCICFTKCTSIRITAWCCYVIVLIYTHRTWFKPNSSAAKLPLIYGTGKRSQWDTLCDVWICSLNREERQGNWFVWLQVSGSYYMAPVCLILYNKSFISLIVGT